MNDVSLDRLSNLLPGPMYSIDEHEEGISEADMKQISAWNSQYNASRGGEYAVLIRNEEGKLVGFVQYDVLPDHVYVEWFVAPKHGAKSIEALFDYFKRNYPRRRRVKGHVSYTEDNLKMWAKLLYFYTSFGCVVTRVFRNSDLELTREYDESRPAFNDGRKM